MENNFNNRDFEQFVKQNADQYRMFPSEKVWNGINNTLHTRRRWYGIGLGLLLLTTAGVTWVMLLSPSGKKEQVSSTPATFVKKSTAPKKQTAGVAIIAPAKPVDSKVAVADHADNLLNNLFLADVIRPFNDEVSQPLPAIVQNDLKPAVTVTMMANQSEIIVKPAPFYNKETVYYEPVAAPVVTPVHQAQNDNLSEGADIQKETAITQVDDKVPADKKDIYPLSIESVINSYTRITKRKRLSWQIYFLPTISYRKLTENKSFLLNTQQVSVSNPSNSAVTNDINNVVTHKPDIGLEFGFNVAYPLGRTVKITAGLQLNLSKYDIKAYPYAREDARIALSNNNGSASVSTVQTNYRNFETYTKPDWLSNFYVSASLPIGLEMNVTNISKTYLGIGSTIQPTYILGDRAYLISTDFKNYAKIPSLTRGWNVSSSIEVFAGYSTGKIKWKVGPQVRYQLLSSFVKKYPVKEHLIDFGLKVGVMLK